MRLRIEPMLLMALSLACFSGLQGGKYFMGNRLQELGIGVSLLLYVYGAYQAAFVLRPLRWWLWVAATPLFAGGVMVTWSIAFASSAGTGVMPSLFASREFLLLFLAPSIYFLHLSGISVERLLTAIVAGAALTLVSYLVFYFRIDMPAAFFDTGSYLHHLVTYDEARGFRLKPPTYAMILIALASLFTLFRKAPFGSRVLSVAGLAVCGYVWSLVQLRAVAAGVLVGLLVFGLFWRRPRRVLAVIAVLPLAVLAVTLLSGLLLEVLLQSHGAEVRLASFNLALDQFSQRWLLGWGQSSGHSKTYQDLFGPKFFPSDLGIVGILFKYGAVGGLLYIAACIGLLLTALGTYWRVKAIDPSMTPVFAALLVFATVMTINMVLWPGLAYGQGLTMAAVVIGLAASTRQAAGCDPSFRDGLTPRSAPGAVYRHA